MRNGLIRPVAVFDIETEGWDRFFCGCVLLANGESHVFTHEREADMVRCILAIGEGDVLAHNGGRFDTLWFLDAMFRHGLFPDGAKIQAIESGASIITLAISGPGLSLRIRDSFRMFPVSLRVIGGKDEVGVPCEFRSDECKEAARLQEANGEPITGCGGYCAIRIRMPRAQAKRIREYCAQDCRALWDGANRLIAFAESLNLSLSSTTGATAWKTAKDWGLIEPTPLTHREWHWIRDAYFGGRVGLFNARAAEGWHYDITSSYPFQMSQKLPEGRPDFYPAPSDARRKYRAGKPGVYQASVTVPDMPIPPVPWRAIINGERRNAYPVGKFAGSWVLPELEYAESIGCKVEPLAAMVFPDERDAFRPLMEFLIAERLKHGKATAEGQIIKLWANSGYGKLAQEPRTHRLVFARSSFEAGADAVPINKAQTAWLVPYSRTPPLPDSSHAEKAAYITARGRIQLHRMLTARGGTDAIYCDTDSVFSTKPRSAADGVRKGLGGWADEGEFRDFRAVAPKLYRYDQVNPGKRPTPVLRAKGIALPKHVDALAAARAWDLIESGGEMHNRSGVLSLRTAMRRGGGLFVRKDIKRSTAGVVSYGDRLPARGTGSRPPKATELIPHVRPFIWK